jgi:hypothetical protein
MSHAGLTAVADESGGHHSTVTDSHPSLRLFAYQVSETAEGGCRGTSSRSAAKWSVSGSRSLFDPQRLSNCRPLPSLWQLCASADFSAGEPVSTTDEKSLDQLTGLCRPRQHIIPLQTSDGSKCQVCGPVRVNGTNQIDAKPFSAEVLCAGRRDGEVVCCCERR